MDGEIKAHLDLMEARLMARLNAGFERVLIEITTLKTDFQNTKGFLLKDAIVIGRRALSIEDRLTGLEREQP